MSRRIHILSRVFRRLAWTLFGSAGVLSLLVLLLLGTPPGREQVRSLVLPLLNRSIPGKIDVRELTALSPWGVELKHLVIRDPAGDGVVRAQRIKVSFDPRALLQNRVDVGSVEVVHPFVDLRRLDSQDRGLLSAFVDRSSEGDSDAGAPASKWQVRIASVHLRQGKVVAEVPKLGEVQLLSLDLLGRIEVASQVSMQIRNSSAVLSDAQGRLGRMKISRADYYSQQPSTIRLHLDLGPTALNLMAKGRITRRLRECRAPISAHLNLKQLGPETLHRLGLSNFAQLLLAPLDTELDIGGNYRALILNLHIESPSAGRIALQAELSKLAEARWSLETAGLHLDRMLRNGPQGSLDANATGHVALAPSDKGHQFTLRFDKLRLGEQALSSLDAKGTIAHDHIRVEALDVRGYGGGLQAHGQVGFDGDAGFRITARLPSQNRNGKAASLSASLRLKGGKIAAQGSLRARRFGLAHLSVDQAQMDIRAKGALPWPQIEVEARTEGLRWKQFRIPGIQVILDGGPRNYTVDVDGKLPRARLRLWASARRKNAGVDAQLSMRGVSRGKQFRASMENLWIGYDGSIEVSDGQIVGAGQKIDFEGRYAAGRAERAMLRGEALELSALSQALGLEPELKGSLSLRATLDGETQRPNIEVWARGRGVRYRDSEPFGLRLDGHINTPANSAGLEFEIARQDRTGPGDPSLASFTLEGTLGPGRRLNLRKFERGTFVLNARLHRLNSQLLAHLGLPRLPLSFELNADLTARGKPLDPDVTLTSKATLGFRDRAKEHRLIALLRHKNGVARLNARVDDAKGRWADARIDANLTPESEGAEPLREALRAGLSLLGRARYSAALRLAERSLNRFPIQLDEPLLKAMQAQATFKIEHEPHAEPTGCLELRARIDALPSDLGTCAVPDLKMRLDVLLGEGSLRHYLSLKENGENVVIGRGSMDLRAAPALAGRGPFRIHEVGGQLQLIRLDMARIPVLCRYLVGNLAGRAAFVDLLGKRPQVDLSIDSRGLRRSGGSAGVDLDMEALLTHSRLRAEGWYGPSGSRKKASSLFAQLPIGLSNGRLRIRRDAPIQGRIRIEAMPLSPLASRQGAIGYATGTANGWVDIQGSLNRPKPKGVIEVRNAQLVITPLAQQLRDVHMQVDFDRERVALRTLTARDLGGKISASGDLKILGNQRQELRLQVSTDAFPLRQEGQRVADLWLQAEVNVQRTTEQTHMLLRLSDVTVWIREIGDFRGLSLKPHPDIVSDDADAVPADDSESQAADPIGIQLDATRGLWVNRNDFSVKLATRLNIEVDGAEARIKGNVDFERGYLELMGVIFNIERGSQFLFVASDPPNPVLDLTAEYPGSVGSESIRVTIKGRMNEPQLSFFVDGEPATAGDVVLAIYGSSRSGQDEQHVSSQALSFVSGVVASVVSLSARRELGAALPILVIEPSESGTGGRVRAGFELSGLIPEWLENTVRGVYMEGILARQDGLQNQGLAQTGVLLELFFPNDLVWAGQYGPGQTWSVDFGWEP